MKLLKLSFVSLSMICCISAYESEKSTEDAGKKFDRWSKIDSHVVSRMPIDLSFWGRSVFGPDEVEIVSYVLPEAQLLYNLYNRARGNEAMFVDLVQRNRRGLSVNECIAILKRNEQVLKDAGEKIDQAYASSYKLSTGFLYGAATLGGLFGLYKSSKMIQDMYWRKRAANEEAENIAFAKIAQLESAQKPGFFQRLFKSEQPGFLNPNLFESEEGYKKYMEYLNTMKVPERWGDEEFEALIKKYNIADTKGVHEYIKRYGLATYASTLLYAGGFYNLMEYLKTAYRASQWQKLQHEQLVKDKQLCEKMLQILQNVQTAQ